MTTATTGFSSLTGTYTLDSVHSRLGFVARHAMVTKVRGSFNEFEGSA
ncbi:MAG: polyisoprenoid-binding protein, partial [Jatrophihabitans sp.]|nr:polyisoprenoid-binding protein [Jatrophihabitans sp.]